jgi:hypothetical protein
MKIKFVISPSGEPFNLAYHVGEEADINAKQAQDLIDSGFAISIEDVVVKPKATRASSPKTKAETAEKR